MRKFKFQVKFVSSNKFEVQVQPNPYLQPRSGDASDAALLGRRSADVVERDGLLNDGSPEPPGGDLGPSQIVLT